MFSRHEHELKPVLFPTEWTNNLKQIMLNIYGDHCIKEEKTFEVYGFSYPKEVLLIISYVGLDKFTSPLTLSLSADLNEKTDTDALINDMSDAAGIFFDNYFAIPQSEDEIFDEYVLDWQEGEFGKAKFHYMVTRENIGLTIQADILLGE